MVWKFDKTKSPIHCFNNHFKRVTCLLPLKEDLFLSASLDGTLRVWSLNKFQQLYCLNISEGQENPQTFVRMYDSGRKVLMADGTNVVVNQMHLILENYLVNDAII